MKVLILSDIHGNWPALRAVLETAEDVDRILCLGDLVNYGPQAAECVMWAKEILPQEWVIQGNPDRAFGCGEESHCSPACQFLALGLEPPVERNLSEILRLGGNPSLEPKEPSIKKPAYEEN